MAPAGLIHSDAGPRVWLMAGNDHNAAAAGFGGRAIEVFKVVHTQGRSADGTTTRQGRARLAPMTDSVDFIPSGSPPIVPYLTVNDGPKALDFYQTALGATVASTPMYMPDGRIGHVTLRVGDALFMMSDAFPDMGVHSPTDLGGSPVTIMLYGPDCDAATKRMVDAGGELEMPPTNQFYGNRDSRVKDPFGHRWNLATRMEELTAEEIAGRAAEWATQMAEGG